jgi:ribosomal protein L11 methyltransferase
MKIQGPFNGPFFIAMENYIEIILPEPEAAAREQLMAALTAIGFEGFEETETELKAFIPESGWQQEQVQEALGNRFGNIQQRLLPSQNWNQVWESNFEPVQVDDFVGVRAAFHPPFTGVEHELIITPKMSFGTGHHATTWLVMQAMRNIPFQKKTVLDFGTGTGILAILAEKLGAAAVLGIDYDDWCIENARENCTINLCNRVEIGKGDQPPAGQQFDIVLANVNRHIILEHIDALVKAVAPGGELIYSGLLTENESEIRLETEKKGLIFQKTTHRNGWVAMIFISNNS